MKLLVAVWTAFALLLSLSVGACGGGSSSTPVPAPVEVLDQDAGVTSGNLSPVYGQVDRAQTFTVGETGLLSQISLMVHEPMPAGAALIIDVRDTTGGVPNESDAINNVWFTFSVAAGVLFTSANEYVNFDVANHGLQVTAGQVLAIVLRSPGGASTGYDWSAATPDPYAGGSYFYRDHNGTNLWTAESNLDHGFRTYVTR